MIEIIPNWHPIFVHFTVALLSLTVCFHILCYFLSEGKLKQQFSILARWNLWLGTGFGIITALAGWFAYNRVTHDVPSHAAMTDHRNWALVTLTLFIILMIWSLWYERIRQFQGRIFLMGLIIGGILLTTTAWRGAEVVYRYGLGVMSLPQAADEGHSHNHDKSENVQSLAEIKDQNIPDQLSSESVNQTAEHHDGHQH